eukprot:CAMPEP_0181231796 /NCGR_PEP_ID=MMETSP1096-20121128/35324_1 /TAXON_ID=156174 ORGANISM="Chrysochromulina ericina, Strain CCMP281" /NCGR_SAMPLE_ID=MMETSP1096 /ASSEMBLY_ACC=CAM_ASM_000453 /LENGTH=151 /DNA_ID=CAMNT_0023325915 /DNA_START=145 /DNA_END=601 /DNA_ORIENTATION=-
MRGHRRRSRVRAERSQCVLPDEGGSSEYVDPLGSGDPAGGPGCVRPATVPQAAVEQRDVSLSEVEPIATPGMERGGATRCKLLMEARQVCPGPHKRWPHRRNDIVQRHKSRQEPAIALLRLCVAVSRLRARTSLRHDRGELDCLGSTIDMC